MVTITPSERFTPYSPVVPTTVFAVGFPILDNADVVLMHNGSVVAGAIVSGTFAEGVSTNAIITAPVGLVGAVQVVGQRIPQRTSQYAAGKPLPISDHNYALNRVEMEIQETRRETNRSLKLPVGDKPVDFPAQTARAGKYLSFDTDGNPVAVTDVHEVATVAAIASEIVTVANISGAVVAVKDNATNINKVAAIDTAVTAVGAVAEDIPTVVIMRPEIQAVIADKTNIGMVASHIGNVDKVAAIDQAVTKVAAIDAAVSTVSVISADVTKVSSIAPAVTTVANDRLTITAVAANKTNIDAVAANKLNIDAAVANAANINAVAGNATNINAVAANGADIDLVAANMPKVNIVASIAPQVVIVAAIAPEVAAVGAVASSVPVVAAIDDKVAAVAANAANVTAVANNKANIDAVAGNKTNIDAVKNNATNINTVAADKANIDTVATNIAKVGVVAGIAPNVSTVAGISANVTTVAGVAPQVATVAGIDDEVVAVAGNAFNINAVSGNKPNIDIVAANAGNVSTVAGNIAAVNTTATNIDVIIVAPEKAQIATDKAEAAARSATDAQTALTTSEGIFVNMKGGVAGQILMKLSGVDYAYKWETPTGGGDVFKSVIDPKGKNADAYNMANFDEAPDALKLTDAERVAITANTTARHNHSNKAVLDATTASFLTTEKTKLGGIPANATANTGTVTSVAVAVPTGFTVTSAITTSGTITIGNASGYQAYTTAEATKLNGIDLSLYQALSQRNAANGYAGLGVDGKILITMLPDAVLGAMRFTGFWNAATNSPAIPVAAPANNGWYYIVQVAGASSQGGVTDWEVGDWIVSNGTSWGKIDNTDAVVSVAGLKGAISTAALKAALALNLVDNTSDANKPVSSQQQTALDLKLDKTGQAADSARLGNETAAQWQAKIAAAGNWPGVSKSDDSNETNFPIGHTLLAFAAVVPARNKQVLQLRYHSENNREFIASGAFVTPLLTGVWRMRGVIGNVATNMVIEVERVE